MLPPPRRDSRAIAEPSQVRKTSPTRVRRKWNAEHAGARSRYGRPGSMSRLVGELGSRTSRKGSDEFRARSRSSLT